MKRTTAVNGALLAAALAAALAGGLQSDRSGAAPPRFDTLAVTRVQRVALPGGGQGILDGSGTAVPLRRYDRIVSTSLLSDRLLLELAEPDRVRAFSVASAKNSPWRWRFQGRPAVDGFGPLEAIIALKPDLVLINVYGTEARVERLREAGITVFNLGELRGMSTLLPMAEVIGELLGDGERGRRFAASFQQRMRRVAAPLGAGRRRGAIYLAVIGSNIFGGTRGTSYHDVLTHAGLVDVAAERFRDWPQYRAEEIAALDPELVVTKDGMAEAVCAHPGLQDIGACRQPGRILTLPAGLVDEPGVAMLDAAEQLFAKAYPDLAGR
jgi:iron complex transport system substrate-binding protein